MQVQFTVRPALQFRLLRRGTPRRPAPRPESADAAMPEAPQGCGWYQSSHELSRGLLIREGGVELVIPLWLQQAPQGRRH